MIMLGYKKYVILFVICMLANAGFGQTLVTGARALGRKGGEALSSLEHAAAQAAPRAKLFAPLDNGRIEALAKRGKEKMIIQRALAVAVQNHSPLAYVLGPGGVWV